MEEAQSSKNGNHDPRKSVRLVCEEGKAVKVTNNQNYKHNRNDKSVKDFGRSSPSGNSSKKSKQNDVCSEKQGDNKSCKVNSCIPGTKETGSNLQERSHGKAKKSSNLSSAMENLKQTKAQPVGENFPGSHVLGNGIGMESLTATQKGKLLLENPLGVHTLKTNVDQTALGDMNSESTKEHTLEADYLESTAVIDESNLTAEQQLGLKQAEERLERDYISRLEKRSPEYTNCQYLCKLCLVHIENIQGAHKHIKEKRHKKNIMEKQEENELRALPPPSSAQLAALSFTLIEAANEQGISDDDFRIRQDIVKEMEKIIQQPLPAVYSDVESDFHAKVPVVFCKDVKSGLTCKVSARNDVACLTTDLLAALGKLEPVLIPLVLAFRYWARSVLAFKTPHQVSLGQLWLELLKFYTLEFALEEYVISIRVQELLTRENKNWPKRRIAIEDPFALKRNVARSLNSQMVFEYILERFRTAYKYFACPQSKDGIKSKPDTKKKEKGKMNNKKSPKAEEPISNCCLPQGEKVVDKQNTVSGCNISENELECNEVVEAVAKRCTSRNVDSSLLSTLDSSYDEDKEEALSFVSNECCELKQKSLKERDDSETSVCISEGELSHHSNCSEHHDTNSSNEFSDAESRQSSVTESSQKNTCTGTPATSPNCKAVVEAHDLKDEGRLTTEEMHYVFDKFIFTSGKPPTIVCSICKRDGHSKNDCPEDFKKIDLKPLPPMTDRFREILDIVCKRCFDELSPPLSEQQNREQILASLERFIRKEYNDKARLCLFGSSKNGFGFRDSDLDICMTLEGHENAEKLNCKEIIEGLAKVLKKHPGLRNILPITTAKVPIVKFEHRRSGLEGDISLYNTLRCDIGDASRGSLSSYAYILMVLYFLQQRNPPVIPVLQEIFDGKQIPQRMVDGWNAFFFDDMEELKKRLPALGKNTESLGELWLGLLRFYTEEFDFKEYVISIRQKKLLTTFEKQWTSKCIAIEDPFDLNHNLGAGVSRKMTNFIMKAFINGRKLFGTPFYPTVGREAEYFFDSKVLTDGELAPNDRCCRVCGKIGHYMKDCPKRRRLKKKENEKDDEKEVKEEDRETREKRCFICGDVGHVRRDCPEFKQTRQRNNSVPGTQLVRSMVNSQLVAVGQQQAERPLRTRQSSECSDSHQSSYSPQPQQFTQNSSQPASINQTQPQPISQSKHVPQPQQGAQPPHQVQLPLFNFPQSPPGQYSTLHNLGLLQMHHHHQIQLPNTSWPIHGPVIHSAPGNPPHSTNSSVSLNDPSIIFAQPAARPMGIPSTSHEGHWHNPVTPNSLVNNGTVGNSGQFGKMNPPSVPWDHGTPTHFPLLRGAWPYNMPQNYMQQGNASYPPSKPFYPQGTRIRPPLAPPRENLCPNFTESCNYHVVGSPSIK
uniref:Terminal uridylyl transferase 4 n=1 Tax=Amazona collaria TaxID=241587 RepID=A0A8B9FQ46_9PSIT